MQRNALEGLHKKSFYFEKFTRADAEAHLRAQPPGAFLVRPSSIAGYSLAMSTKGADGTVTHTKLLLLKHPQNAEQCVGIMVDREPTVYADIDQLAAALSRRSTLVGAPDADRGSRLREYA
eukprot:CAMPEP_0198330030 /NCGR_PEP_ID=MMETSP1450-20131203/16611_1 /TAXON_ID=753684 ORGANISM="Madagascaria erythrocladiodes, Strain CCMP3234" /NCGR_SAMPLE_ID=MMETSP1450 /ASSEMBLY_ACC=CAM_ASM_001115 /LENGTH=120 /DNA_ID=CAMNT_0044034291 /DNA_START=155 /DNA_END=514 /DNA_ORIENTATION=+